MNAKTIVWVLALAIGLTAGWIDLRTRRIPNWLTVAGALLGLALHTYQSGRLGAAIAIQGMLLALVILFPLVLLRAMGAGDWKLMGAIGAILGPIMMLFVLVGAIFLSGLMAMAMMTKAGRVKETFKNVYVLVQGFLSFGLRANPEISLDNPHLMKLPFGVAVAVADVLCFVASRWKW